MKKSKFTDEQIAFALKQAEVGTPVEEVCGKMGISDCEFRYKLDSDSSRSWTVIPRQAGHRFQRNLDSPKS